MLHIITILSDQNSFDRVNSVRESRLKITPFTTSDWKFINQKIIALPKNETEQLQLKLKNLKLDLKKKETSWTKKGKLSRKLRNDCKLLRTIWSWSFK